MIVPRSYQTESTDLALAHMRRTDEPGVLVLTTGAGKSICIAILAHVVEKAKKRVLCLAPNSDLIVQNASKYRAIGEHCSLYSASLNKKHKGHAVVFATPISVANSLDDFNDDYALLVIDEAHGVGEDEETSYQKIIDHLSKRNPKLRILGLTATPMRGKINLIGHKRTFKHIIHDIPHSKLSEMGYVVPYRLGYISDHYDMVDIKVQSNGKFKQADIDNATLNKERLTRAIIADAIKIMDEDGRKSAMIFAASVKHAQEILSYLPEGSGALVIGNTKKDLRKNLIDQARDGKWRFLITVSALGTGVDIPICDTTIFLRATESLALFLQFIGRACRLYDPSWAHSQADMNWTHPDYQGKKDALVLDYGQNIERFSLDDDLTITGLVAEKNRQDDDEDFFEIDCPDCGTANRHTAQRCVGISHEGIRCGYRFIFKECPSCNAKNSPSARHCYKCEGELIDPNDKLSRKAAIGAGTPYYVAVIEMTLRSHWKGESQSLRVTYRVTDGDATWEVSEYLKPPYLYKFIRQCGGIANNVDNAVLEAKSLATPSRLMIKRPKGSKYYQVVSRYDH